MKANGHWIRADHVIIMTHVPLQGEKNLIGATLFQTKLCRIHVCHWGEIAGGRVSAGLVLGNG